MTHARSLSIAEGALLPEALDQAAGGPAWVQATGVVDDPEVCLAGEPGVRTHKGRFTLVSLVGQVGGPYGVALVRAAPGGNEVFAGHLVRARVVDLSAAALPFEPAASWASIAVATAEAAADDEPEEPEMPDVGDRVEHFAFGLCNVVGTDGERLRIRSLGGHGRVREISLSMLEVGRPVASGGRRVFKLLKRT